jgi:aminoglycoside phosphotransferase (APT) family kinase protein
MGREELHHLWSRWSRATGGIPLPDCRVPEQAAVARVRMAGDRWVLRARVLGPGTDAAFRREVALVDRVRPLLPLALPDPLAADDGTRAVAEDGLLWTLHRALPGRPGRSWQDLHRASRDERRALARLLRDSHDRTRGRLGPGDRGAFVRDLDARVATLRTPVPDAVASRLRSARERVEASAASLPDAALAFVHGDFHDGNVLHDDRGAPAGLIDLDACRVADPLEDLAYLAMMLARGAPGEPPRPAALDEAADDYGLPAADRLRLDDLVLLYALFDVALFETALSLPDRGRWRDHQVATLAALSTPPAP